jgi:hypothetical protein
VAERQRRVSALKTLEQGGNAVDTTITLFSVLTVTKPDMVSPAGGGWHSSMAKTGRSWPWTWMVWRRRRKYRSVKEGF